VFSLNVNGQVSVIQNVINKIEGYNNFSYHSINKTKEYFTNDTTINQYNSLFVKVPEDKKFGYLFNVETQNKDEQLTYSDLYNGQNLIHIIPKDSSYISGYSFDMLNTLRGYLQWIRVRLEKPSSKIMKTKDTTINAINCYHLIATVWDTLIDKERNYTDVHLFIDKLSDMPVLTITSARYSTLGNGITTYYSATGYFDYKVNQSNISTASISIPNGLHQQKAQPALPKKTQELLPMESIAPDWTLYDSEGKKMSLAQLKGKIILIDFFFVGCGNCMESIKPLSKLHERYKKQNVAIVSLTFRDNEAAATAFKKNFNIAYPIYIDASDVIKSYKVIFFPTFYFIDKEGKIANAIIGYDANFEKKASSIIDKLLSYNKKNNRQQGYCQ
jgi:peroxiredoxin